MVRLKYAERIELVPSCPPVGIEKRSCRAFRFVHEDISDRRNAEPPAVIKPNRKFKSDVDTCAAFALSMYTHAAAAKAYYQNLVDAIPLIGKTVGTHLAVVDVVEEDGFCTEVGPDGHFDLFESESASWTDRFIVVGPVI